MKTVEEEAKKYIVDNSLEDCTLKQYFIDCFTTAYEFANKWYTFDEELPAHDVKVLTKDIHNEPISFRFTGSSNIKESAKLMGFTHWQPIRL